MATTKELRIRIRNMDTEETHYLPVDYTLIRSSVLANGEQSIRIFTTSPEVEWVTKVIETDDIGAWVIDVVRRDSEEEPA